MNYSSRNRLPWWHRLVAILMVFVLLGAFTPNIIADDDPPPGPPQEVAAAGCAIGVVVIIVGIYVIYKLVKLCNRLLPPTPAPAPPPPAVTNAPPTLPTNSIPARPKGGITMYPQANMAVELDMDAMPELKLNDVDVKSYDIAAAGHLAPDGSLYHTYIPMDMSTSTNLTNWEPLSVKIYVSATAVLTQSGTNGAQIMFKNMSTPAWMLDLGLPPGTSTRFVRSSTWVGSP